VLSRRKGQLFQRKVRCLNADSKNDSRARLTTSRSAAAGIYSPISRLVATADLITCTRACACRISGMRVRVAPGVARASARDIFHFRHREPATWASTYRVTHKPHPPSSLRILCVRFWIDPSADIGHSGRLGDPSLGQSG